MGANPEGHPFHLVVKRSPRSRRGDVHNMTTSYYQHADNLSIWLTNARDAAAKVREETMIKSKETRENYHKFMRDLQHRVAESYKKKKAASARFPPAKFSRLVQADSNCEGLSKLKNSENTRDLFNQASRNDEVSRHDAQLGKKAKYPLVTKHGDPDCQTHAVCVGKEEPQINRRARRKEETHVLCNESEQISAAHIVKSFVVVIPTPPLPQKPELVVSEPCTPRHPLEGWSIPTSFSALDMRDVDELVALASPASSRREPEISDTKVPPLILPTPVKDGRRQETETFSQKLSARRKLQTENATLYCRATSSDMGMKCSKRIHSTLTSAESADTLPGNKLLPWTSSGATAPRLSPFSRQLRRNHDNAGQCPSHPYGDGVTKCSMGVVVWRGRDEYENRGQGKQFFSDVWKCAMDAERRYASERARLLHDVKRKRLKQLQIEKEQRVAMLKERALTRQRVAVQTHLEMVANLKAKRESAIQRNRILEKRRFADALRAVRKEKLHEYGLRLPPLCNCKHGEDPLNPEYIRKCQSQCKLRNNFQEYTVQLERTLQYLLEEVCSLLASQAREKGS